MTDAPPEPDDDSDPDDPIETLPDPDDDDTYGQTGEDGGMPDEGANPPLPAG